MHDRRPAALRTLLVALLLAGITFLLFARSAGYGFIDYDDPRYILQNTAIQAGFDAESLRWAFLGHGDIWNPLVRLTHILDVELFGLNATGHHWHNIAWHALNAALAFLLLRRLTGAFWTSAFCAALFAWHPLRVESVTWISERKDVVSVCFGLLTLLAYTAYAQRRATGHRARSHFALVLLAYTAALLSKPSMVALPGVLLLLDYWPLGRWPFAPAPATGRPLANDPTRRLLLEKLPLVGLAALASFIVVHTQSAAGFFVLELPLGARVANAIVSLPRYVGKFLWPFDLSTAYRHPGWWPLPVIAGATLAVLTVCVTAWRTRHTQPWIAVGSLWFVGMLLPMIGLLQVGFQSIADRYTYFPILGIQIALLWTLRAYLPPRLPRWIPMSLATLLLLGCGVRTWHQQGYWRDPITLTRQGVAASPQSPVAHAFLGYTYAIAGQRVEARDSCERALALDPRNETALLVLAETEAAEGRPEAALPRYRALVEINPANTDNALALANYLLGLKRLDEAEALLSSLARQPKAEAEARLGLALLAVERNDRNGAIERLRAAHTAFPDHVPILRSLTYLLHLAGHVDEASSLFTGALARQPRAADLLRVYSAFLRTTGRPEEALSMLDRALARRPHNLDLRRERAQLLAAAGRIDDALLTYSAILQKDSRYVPAAYESALLYEQRGDTAQAIDFYQRAIAAQPGFIPAHLALAHLAERNNLPAEADAAFAAALAARPDDPLIHRNYAEVLARRRDFAGALRHYQRNVELAPTDAEAHAGCGFMFFLTGRRSEALARWEEALRLRPDFPGLRARVDQLRASER